MQILTWLIFFSVYNCKTESFLYQYFPATSMGLILVHSILIMAVSIGVYYLPKYQKKMYNYPLWLDEIANYFLTNVSP